jgi:hypothetical protein
MDYDAIVTQALTLLQREQRLSYRVLKLLRLSRFKLARPPTPRDTEVSNAYAITHDSLGPVCICSLIGINSIEQPVHWVLVHPSGRIPYSSQAEDTHAL